MRRRDLTPGAGDVARELGRVLAEAKRDGSTIPHGIKDMGASGDATWTDPDTGTAHSVRDLPPAVAGVSERVQTAQDAADAAAGEAQSAKAEALAAVEAAGSAATQAQQAQSAADDAASLAQQATSAAQSAQTAADTATADLLALAGRTGRVYRQATAPTGGTVNDLWIDADDGRAYTYDGSQWIVVTDDRITAAASAADQAANLAATAQTAADDAASLAQAAQTQASGAQSAADGAQATATAAQSAAATADAKAAAAASAAATAQARADAARRDAVNLLADWEPGGPYAWPNATVDTSSRPAGVAASWKLPKTAGAGPDVPYTPVVPGRRYRLECWIMADKPGSITYIEIRRQDNGYASSEWVNAGGPDHIPGGPSYPVSLYEVPTSWTRVVSECVFSPATTAVRRGAVYANHPAGTVRDATVWIAGLRLYEVDADAAAAQTAADQAAQAAADARQIADNAAASALAAQSTADAAGAKATTADGRYTVAAANPTSTDATGKPEGAVWEVRSGGTAVRRYVLTSGTWTQITAGTEFIGSKAITAAQIGDAAIGTAQIADLAVTNAKIGDLSVGKLTATGGATFPTAVMQTLISDQAFLGAALAQALTVAPSDNLVRGLAGEGGGAGISPGSGMAWDATLGAWMTLASGYYYLTFPAVLLAAGDEYVVEMQVRSSQAGQVVYARLQDGLSTTYPLTAATSPGAGNYSLNMYTIAAADTWYTLTSTATATGAQANRLQLWPNHSAGTTANATLWVRMRLRRRAGAVDIRDGQITADKIAAGSVDASHLAADSVSADNIVASEAMWGKLAAFGSVTTGMLEAGNATITSDLIADTITGKTITGGTITGARIQSAPNGARVEMTSGDGLRVYDADGVAVELSATQPNGLAVRNPVTNTLVPLASHVFGLQTWTAPGIVYGSYGPDGWSGVKDFGVSDWFTLSTTKLLMLYTFDVQQSGNRAYSNTTVKLQDVSGNDVYEHSAIYTTVGEGDNFGNPTRFAVFDNITPGTYRLHADTSAAGGPGEFGGGVFEVRNLSVVLIPR